MFDALERAEGAMPELLVDRDAWTGVYADAAKPHLLRLWRQWGDLRVYLHLFEGCDAKESYGHPHPWNSAMRVWGRYEMGISRLHAAQDTLAVVRLRSGSVYEMTSPMSIHWVRPMDEDCFTVMVAGPVVYPVNRVSAQKKVRGLTTEERERLFALAAAHYPSP